jgi:hypothetical protein
VDQADEEGEGKQNNESKGKLAHRMTVSRSKIL